MLAALDAPTSDMISDPLSVRFEGWVHAGEQHGDLHAVELTSDGAVIGRTELFFVRSDVNRAHHLPDGTTTGFSILVDVPQWIDRGIANVSLTIVLSDGTRVSVLERTIRVAGRDYRAGDWGLLLKRDFPHLVRRQHMYNSGPSLDAPSAELLTLLPRYLPSPPSRVLDVGCGRGAYAPAVRSWGHDWFGAEIKPEDCAVLAEKALPHRQVDGGTLPFAAGEFDAALCIEVLEHIVDPWSFVADVRRVISRRLIVSVPNLELVTYWRAHLAVPWHLLESDHRNFFSRVSLKELLRPHFSSVEVISYGDAPLRTAEGAPLGYHLLAIASV